LFEPIALDHDPERSRNRSVTLPKTMRRAASGHPSLERRIGQNFDSSFNHGR
jgi:hypothetical protein